jgi:hypothetical protein
VDCVLAEGTIRLLNLEVCRLSWKVGVVGETSRGVLGIAVAGDDGDDEDIERRDSIGIPIVDEAEDVCATCEVGAKNAT